MRAPSCSYEGWCTVEGRYEQEDLDREAPSRGSHESPNDGREMRKFRAAHRSGDEHDSSPMFVP